MKQFLKDFKQAFVPLGGLLLDLLKTAEGSCLHYCRELGSNSRTDLFLLKSALVLSSPLKLLVILPKHTENGRKLLPPTPRRRPPPPPI